MGTKGTGGRLLASRFRLSGAYSIWLVIVSLYVGFCISGAALAEGSDDRWSALDRMLPWDSHNQVRMRGGAGIESVLLDLFPGVPQLDGILQSVIDQIDTLEITRRDGRMHFDLVLVPASGMDLEIQQFEKTKTGQIYLAHLDRYIHFEIMMQKDVFTIADLKGLSGYLRLPMLPDKVVPTDVLFDIGSERVTVTARLFGNMVEVVARANIRSRNFGGLDWVATAAKNLPLFLALWVFTLL